MSIDDQEKHELVRYERKTAVLEPRTLTAMQADPQKPGDLSLSACYHILRKRRWTVFTVAFVLTTVAAIVSFRMTPVYRATARVQVEAEPPVVQSLTEIYQKTEADDAFLQTQIQVLKSDNLAWKTVEQLGLAQNPTFIGPGTLDVSASGQRKIQLINAFRANLSVELVPKTRMLVVGYDSTDPELASQVATGLVNNYIDYNFRQKYDSTRQASGWMEQQLDELKAKVEKSQQTLVAYERENEIVNTNDKQSVTEEMLSDATRDLSAAQSDRIQKESLYRHILANTERLAVLLHNELLQRLDERAADLKGQYTEALAQYGPNFPKVLRLEQQIADNQKQIEGEQARVLDRMRNDYTAAQRREEMAASVVAKRKEQVGKLNQLLVQHNLLQRDFETNQQLYQNLLQRLKDATVSAGLRSTNLHMVDTALPPAKPIRPKKMLNIAIAMFTGLILGVMGAFAQEGLDHSIKTVEDIENLLVIPALASIPLDRGSRKAKLQLGKKKLSVVDMPSSTSNPIALSISQKPQSALSEAYRSLGTAIMLSVTPKAPKTLLVTSAQEGEGKTVTALNLAQALAQRNGPVLVIDCDLRKGGIAHALGLENTKGLSTVLTGGDDLDEVVQRCELQPDLFVIPSGPVPPNPAELLASKTMKKLLDKMVDRFEHVVIDSPPVLAVTDATILSSVVDGVVLVAESGATPRGGLMRTRRVLESAGARILGVALNKLDLRNEGYYDRYGYYYYSRYYHKNDQSPANPVA